MRLAATVALAALAACSSKSAPRERPCPERAAELGTWLKSIQPEGDASTIIPSPSHLVEADDAPLGTARKALRVIVTHDKTSVDDIDAPTPEDLRERITEKRELGANTTAGRVVLAIAPDAGMDRVASVAAVLIGQGFTDAGFAFTRKRTAAPPPRSSVSAQIDALPDDPGQRAGAIAHLLQKQVAACPSINALFGQLGAAGSGSKSQLVADGLGDAVAACDCKVDLDALRTEMWTLFGGRGWQPVGIVDVTLAVADDETAVAVSGATWADAAPALRAARGKPVRLVAPAPIK